MKLIEIIPESLNALWDLRKIYFKPILIPTIILFIVNTNALTSYSLFGETISILIEIPMYLLITITIHRLVILGTDSVPIYGFRKPIYNDLSFLLHGIGIAFFTLPIRLLAAIPVLPPMLTIPLTTLISLYIFSRLSLTLPAIAAGHNWSFSDSWKATKECKFILFIISAITPCLFYILLLVSGYLPKAQYVLLFTYPLFVMFFVSLVSVSYKKVLNLNELEITS